MNEEGRISRAMSRAGAGERLADTGSEPALPRSPAPEEPEPQPVDAAGGQLDPGAVMFHERSGEAANQVRALRARLLALNNGQPPRVLTISSANSREGKSLLTINLGIALAQVARGRVVVVDGDIYGGGVSELAGIHPTSGLSNVLADDLRLNGSVYRTFVDGLDIIPTVPLPDDSAVDAEGGSELNRLFNQFDRLLSQECKNLVARLREQYSFVVIDTPAALSSNHAATFGKHSDGVLLVARLEYTRRQVVQRVCRDLKEAGSNILGCVLTDHKHHVPEFLYRLFSPPRYYAYGRYGSYVRYGKGSTGGGPKQTYRGGGAAE